MLDEIAAVRRFNRLYTRQIGTLQEHLLDSAFSLTEARVLYELAHNPDTTAIAIGRELGLDAAYLSRILKRFRQRGLLAGRRSEADGREVRLMLTEAGRAAFVEIDRASAHQVRTMLAAMTPGARVRFLAGIASVEQAMDEAEGGPAFVLRDPRPGDLGWIVHRQAALYHEEYGWDASFESLLLDITAAYVRDFKPEREQCWIADCGGRIAGAVFLVEGDAPGTAKLRMLYVEPWARGMGIGRVLVGACVARAREAGYARLVLWTNDVLVAARRIYQAAGFTLVGEEAHRSFGHDLVAQTWALDLDEPTTGSQA
ncbi:bifunctional helix-turn-helix transcriptional regulator/GNAT family N-acetyltransferase [Marinivivus vitaminiproducens]|uniref:bifunctional helix-turn-helix transcriptional regulator/GNAT family N-acetyltransferase n=1 Tax=Marinivivus vitaminiproducens TaxID=3035935 RepID=UPI00279ABD86|nr:helix-turn-helix domain-containing GNAT family N-acetyltransferase [Geminicoccaceae bacterium SCSIO 64248]